MKTIVEKIIDDHVDIVKNSIDEKQIFSLSDMIVDAFINNKKLIFFGNGGSASDCEHIVAEFVGKFKKKRRSLPAISLTSPSSLITAIGNDFAFENIFYHQIPSMTYHGDICFGLTTSGKSVNVLKALDLASQRGCKTVLMTGEGYDFSLKNLTDIVIVKSIVTERIQEVHLLIGHILCRLVEDFMFNKLK